MMWTHLCNPGTDSCLPVAPGPLSAAALPTAAHVSLSSHWNSHFLPPSSLLSHNQEHWYWSDAHLESILGELGGLEHGYAIPLPCGWGHCRCKLPVDPLDLSQRLLPSGQAALPQRQSELARCLHIGQFLTVYILFSLYLENSTFSLWKVELSIEGASSGSGGRGGGGSKGWLWGGQVITKLLCGCEC